MKRLLTLFLLCLTCSIAVFAQGDSTINGQINVKSIVDSVIRGKHGFAKTKSIVGASICVFVQDSLYFYSYGYQDKEKKRKVDVNTVYEIGANTELFTALLYANELTKGTIDTNILIDRFVPLNKNISGKIRVLQLATGTSGLPQYTFDDTFFMHQMLRQDSVQPLSILNTQSMLNLLSDLTTLPDYNRYKSSYYAYGLLSFILGQAAHSDYHTMLQKNILDPLEMDQTTWEINTADTFLAKGYNNRHQMPYLKLDALAPAAILKSSIKDMGSFLKNQMLADKSVLRGPINAQQVVYGNDFMQKEPLGWIKKRMHSTPTYIQQGDTYGFSSVIGFSQTNNVGVIVLLNSTNPDLALKAFKYIHKEIFKTFEDINDQILLKNQKEHGIPIPPKIKMEED